MYMFKTLSCSGFGSKAEEGCPPSFLYFLTPCTHCPNYNYLTYTCPNYNTLPLLFSCTSCHRASSAISFIMKLPLLASKLISPLCIHKAKGLVSVPGTNTCHFDTLDFMNA